MKVSFDTKIANEYGIVAAILYDMVLEHEKQFKDDEPHWCLQIQMMIERTGFSMPVVLRALADLIENELLYTDNLAVDFWTTNHEDDE